MKNETIDQFNDATCMGNARLRRSAYGVSNDDLIQSYKPLVRKIAWHVHGKAARTSDLDDLMQIGFIALIECSRTYEDRGFAFSTYASTRIRGSMIDHLRREGQVGRATFTAKRKIDDARSALMQRHHRNPTNSEMAQQLGLDPQEFLSLEQVAGAGRAISVDDMEDGAATIADIDLIGPDQLAEDSDMVSALHSALGHLNEREQMVLQLYFHEELNLHEIGAVLDVSAARVCQLKASAMAKLHSEISSGPDL